MNTPTLDDLRLWNKTIIRSMMDGEAEVPLASFSKATQGRIRRHIRRQKRRTK